MTGATRLASTMPALLVLVLAGAPRTAAAQGVGAGVTLELPVLGVKVPVPAGVGEWVVRKDDGGDVLQRTRPVNPYLSVLFNAPDDEAETCADTLAAFAKKGLKKVDKASLVPAGWAPQVLSATSGGETLIAFCAENQGRQLVALVTYASSLDGPDLTSVTPVMEAVGKAVFAQPVAAPETKPTEKAAQAAAAPGDDDGEPQQVTLPRSGLVLLVGGGAEWEARPGKGGRDVITRKVPAEPALSVSMEVVRTSKRDGGCEAILDQYMATQRKGSLQNRPAYLPDTFHENAAESYEGGIGRALTCAELSIGYLIATVAYSGSLDAADAGGARPVLVAGYHAAAGIAKKSRRRAGNTLFGGQSFYSPEFFLGGQRIAPEAEANPMALIDDGTSFVLGVRQAGMLKFSPESSFGLAGHYNLQAGWDSQSDLVLDGVFAIGVGFIIGGKVRLMPMVGGGGDAIGAGADPAPEKLEVAFEIYSWYGGVVAIELTELIGLEATAAYCDRGPVSETRFDGRLMVLPKSFRKVSLGVSYVAIEEVAKIWQIKLGVGF